MWDALQQQRLHLINSLSSLFLSFPAWLPIEDARDFLSSSVSKQYDCSPDGNSDLIKKSVIH